MPQRTTLSTSTDSYAYAIPELLVDLVAWPKPLHTAEADSFAYNTFKIRIPLIVDDILASNWFPPDVRDAMLALRAEVAGGVVQPLAEQAPDVEFWNAVSREHHGRSWLDVPWYWAESYFYRRVLEATRYFQPGHPWFSIDPYANKKRAEIQPAAAPRLVDETLEGLPDDQNKRFKLLCYASLWGNRVDLSYNVAKHIAPAASLEDERAHLLIDDTQRTYDHLAARRGATVAVITDNSGAELLMDLALVDFLLSADLAASVELNLKSQPFYVSDAMPKDVLEHIEALASAGAQAHALSCRLGDALRAGRLQLRQHWFYTTSLMYYQLPDDLRRSLSRFDLVVLKGDANYRRLLGDAHWDPTVPFAKIASYFPTPLLALRTLKAELIAGLEPGEAERLNAVDPAWRTNGQRGVAQAKF